MFRLFLKQLSLIHGRYPEPLLYQEDKRSDQWRFLCLLSLTAMVLILLSNPSSSCHEDQPSRTKAPQPVLPVQPFSS